ncbi:hypothetical protein pb186bvf_011550 [Paramecium bursaria]
MIMCDYVKVFHYNLNKFIHIVLQYNKKSYIQTDFFNLPLL